MGHDDYMADMMTLYQETASKLYKEESVTAAELRRYHGMTGMMVARIASALWSKEELEQNIDKRFDTIFDAKLKVKCEACKLSHIQPLPTVQLTTEAVDPWYTQVIVLLTPWRWAIAAACFSPTLPTVIDKVTTLVNK